MGHYETHPRDDDPEFHRAWADHWKDRTDYWLHQAGAREQERDEAREQLRRAVDALREIKGEVEWFIANRSDVPLSAANSLLKITDRALTNPGGR